MTHFEPKQREESNLLFHLYKLLAYEIKIILWPQTTKQSLKSFRICKKSLTELHSIAQAIAKVSKLSSCEFMTVIWNPIIKLIITINKRSDIVKLWRTENSHSNLWFTSCPCKVIKAFLNSTTHYLTRIILHHTRNGFAALSGAELCSVHTQHC